MKRDRNRLLLPLLMLVSVVLLIGFVSQWLTVQYTGARAELDKDVRQDLKKTSEQLLDSMLFRFMSPQLQAGLTTHNLLTKSTSDESLNQLKDTNHKTVIRITMEGSTINNNHPHSLKELQTITGRNGQKMQITTTDSSQLLMVQKTDISGNTDSLLNGLVARGLKVFVQKMKSASGKNEVLTLTKQEMDSTLGKSLLASNWQHPEVHYRLLFPKKNQAVQPGRSNLIFSENTLFNDRIGVELTNQRSYLLLQILPAFLFAFFLIFITIGAFFLTYRSLRKQVLLNELRTDFVNNISHELKTPVSTVKVALEALQRFNRKSEPEVMGEYLEMMRIEMDRLDTLINQVLNNALLEQQEYLQFEKTDLVALVQTVCREFQGQLSAAGAQIAFEFKTVTAQISADRTHMQGVILNLLDNCLKYGGSHPVIRLSIEETGKEIILEIADEGPGIDPQYLDKLFDKFFRVPTGDQHDVKGYGLGLSYCAQVMKHHHGTITVRNLPGKGCAFRLVFPKDRV